MADTRTVQLHLIATAKPDITTVLKKYPRFLDMNAAVSYNIITVINILSDTSTEKFSIKTQQLKFWTAVSVCDFISPPWAAIDE